MDSISENDDAPNPLNSSVTYETKERQFSTRQFRFIAKVPITLSLFQLVVFHVCFCSKCDILEFVKQLFKVLYVDVPQRPSYGVYISQLIRFARASSHVTDFNNRKKFYLPNFLRKAIGIRNSAKHFPNFIVGTLNLSKNIMSV